MFLISQIWFYLLLAAILGGLIVWLLGLCNCKNEDQTEALRAERDDLLARLAAGAGGAGVGAALASGDSDRTIARLEAELAEARVQLAHAGAGTASGDGEEATALRWRNRYLESRLKFLEDNGGSSAGVAVASALAGAGVAAAASGGGKPKAAAKTKAAPKPKAARKTKAEPAPYRMSAAGLMSEDELEAAVLAAGAGRKPRASRSRANPDELLEILGVGPKNKAWLNEQGIYYFRQIAEMEPPQLAWLANNLPTFGSRVYRENWVAQCDRLMKGLPPRP